MCVKKESTKCSVSLLELMMPLVEVNVKYNNRASAESCHQELLVMTQSQASDARVTGGECVEQSKVECPPDLHNTLVPPCHHVLPISGHQHALDIVRVELTVQLLAIDGEHCHVVTGVGGQHQSLSAQHQVTGRGQLRSTLQ